MLFNLAEAADLAGKRAAMYTGEKINNTEDRSVMHVALRAPKDAVRFWGERTDGREGGHAFFVFFWVGGAGKREGRGDGVSILVFPSVLLLCLALGRYKNKFLHRVFPIGVGGCTS